MISCPLARGRASVRPRAGCTLIAGSPGGREPTTNRGSRAASQKSKVAPAESADDASDLLHDFLTVLLDLPGDTWPDLAVALPNEVFDRIDRWMEVRFAAI